MNTTTAAKIPFKLILIFLWLQFCNAARASQTHEAHGVSFVYVCMYGGLRHEVCDVIECFLFRSHWHYFDASHTPNEITLKSNSWWIVRSITEFVPKRTRHGPGREKKTDS